MAALRNFALSFGLAAAVADANPVLYSRQSGTAGSPCASVSALAASQTAVAPSATPTVPADLAYECINSVPINQTAALNLIKTARPYWEWQSTLAYLKDPPAEYAEKIQDPIDVFAELDALEASVANGTITKEYEFGYTLYRIMQRTHDGHFVYVPDSVGGIFNFGRPIPLVSVSDDGASAPKPYAYPDVLAAVLNNATFTPSAISQIDGEPAAAWLEAWSQYGSLQDRDALYNNVFYELAVVSLGTSGSGMGTFTGGGRGRWVYPGPTTTLSFENGTAHTMQNFAKVLVPFDGVDSGESLYAAFFTTPSDTSFHNGEPSSSAAATSTTSSTASATSTTTTTSTPAPGYPPPVIRQANNLIGGYYLPAPYTSVAVLSVPSFVGSSQQAAFQSTARSFLAAARAAGKTKLVVDVSANGGGTILLGYDLFKQLFPSIDAFAAADRARAVEALGVVGGKFSEVAAGVERVYVGEEGEGGNATLYELEVDVVSTYLNYRTDERVDGKAFGSWGEKFGPVEGHGDEYTELSRWNLSDVLTPYNSGGVWVTGYGEGAGENATQPFRAEDVVVMTDGYCASTCTIFSRLMQDLAGVKHIAMGGRSPSSSTSSSSSAAPIIQAVGGVKGTNNWPWDFIQYNVALAYSYANATERAHFDTTALADYNDQTPFLRAAAGTSYNVNFRDGIKKDDLVDRTPLQFVYEPADCRVYWTKEMTVDVTAAWKAVADSAWGLGGESRCVAGGLAGNGTAYGGERRKRSEEEEEGSVRRRELVESDYPLDLWTDLDGMDLRMDGYMMP
ncbi:peptidase s41 family protein [Diplodia corticola]|uniref:Peptidase s41 family protein n=1 Tax=Diplodia corticola TaxID=236234 RepID=A0A1J9RDL0_9PEZI|nr:peptidase s41 family protein [Diplodia corticola]OJD30635.1 peptidase s41 family protein [Diplodia corticola]